MLDTCVSNFMNVDIREPVISVQAVIAMFTTVSVGFAVFRPYKMDVANNTGVTLLALVVVAADLYISLMTGWEPTYVLILAVITSIPHFVFYGYLVYRIRQCDFKRRLQEWCCCCRNAENVALLAS